MQIARRVKQWWQGIWQPIGTGGRSWHSYDVYGSQPEPTPHELIMACEETVYACASLISNKISSIPLDLCVMTNQGQDQPRVRTAPFDRVRRKKLLRTHRKAMEVSEVKDHPLLNLLEKSNDEHSYPDLMRLTVLYMEIVGHSYWYIRFNSLGYPAELYLLPSQDITIKKDKDGNVEGYKRGSRPEDPIYPPERIIHFKHPDLCDPYSGGYPPLRAVWQAVQLTRKETSSWEAIVQNMARPSIVVNPPDGESWSQPAAERIGKQLTQLFRTSENGGVLAVQDAMKLNILGYPPKDMAGLTLSQDVRQRVCNVYQVPPTLIFMNESNLASAEAGNIALMRDCIAPRMCSIIRTLNQRLVSLYDERLFFDVEDLVPEEKAYALAMKNYELARDTAMIQNQSLTPDEWRATAELPPIPGGDRPINIFGGGGGGGSGGGGGVANPIAESEHEETNPEEQADIPVTSSLRSTVGGLQAIAALQQDYYAGLIPKPAAVASVMLLFGFSAEEADSLFPEIAPVKLTQDETPAPAPSPAPAIPKSKAQQPNPEDKLGSVLLGFMKRQRSYVEGQIGKGLDLAKAKRIPEGADRMLPWTEWGLEKAIPEIIDLSAFDESMARACMPILRTVYDSSSESLTQQLGLDPDLPRLIRQNLDRAVDRQAMAFCQETNATTSLLIEDAMARTKEAIAAGEAAGESLDYLHTRVAEIFDSAETHRVYQIASTEQKRAVSISNNITAVESGVELEKVWMADAQACDFCKRLNGQRRELSQPFAVRGENPIYSTIDHSPAHPACRCDCLYEPKDVNP